MQEWWRKRLCSIMYEAPYWEEGPSEKRLCGNLSFIWSRPQGGGAAPNPRHNGWACEQIYFMQRAALLRHETKQTHAARQDPLAATERSQSTLI